MIHAISGLHLINGRWTESAGETFTPLNPATGEAIAPPIREAGAAEVNAALKAAVSAFDATADLPPRWQAELLDSVAAKILDLGDALLERGESETALPRARMIAERGRTTNQLIMFGKIVREGSWINAVIDTADNDRKPLRRPDLRRMLRPRGPVAVFGASNFPFAFGALGGDAASALAAGCPVVIKGHPSHPGTSELFARAMLEALEERELPLGLFTLLQGKSHELSGALVKHPDIEGVGFTGSLRAGRALFDLASGRPRPVPVFAEMGSVNPVFLLPHALAARGEAIARDLSGSVLAAGGQMCTKPGLVFVVGDNPAFLSTLAATMSAQPPATMLNQNLRESFGARLGEIAKSAGVTPIGKGAPSGHAAMGPSLFATDAVTWKNTPNLHEEAFGPATLVVHCKSVHEALGCVENLEGSLTGTVHAEPDETTDAMKVMRALEDKVGRVVVNGYPTGVEVNDAIVHGGPYPATTDAGTTSVGSAAIARWVRLIAYQDTPDNLLPPALQSANPLGIDRIINGRRLRDAITS